MEYYLFQDIVFSLLKHLNKNSSFNFVNASKHLYINKPILYHKYVYDRKKIKNDNIKKYVRHINYIELDFVHEYEKLMEIHNCFYLDNLDCVDKCLQKLIKNIMVFKNPQDLSGFSKLTSLSIDDNEFNQPLNNLPNTLTRLTLSCCIKFNQPLDNLPRTLISLILSYCSAFNQPINNLPITLKSLSIHGYAFNQSLDNLPTSLNSLRIISSAFNQPLNHLPASLNLLRIWCSAFDQSSDHLPANLKSNCCGLKM